jgi:4-azaleucine resistance transporter AzlC
MNGFWQGFRAMLPLWIGAAPFGVAYAIAAHKIGLTPLEIQLMSLTVYAAAAQMGIVQLLYAGASPVAIVITAVVVSLHHILYGLSLSKRMSMTRLEQTTTAYLLTDAVYGLTIAQKDNENPAFLLGAEVSMFLVWNLFTALGILLGYLITIPTAAHLEFIGPLTFFILLVSLIKTRLDVVVVILSAGLAVVCLVLQLGSATLVIVGIGGAFIGALLDKQA